MKMHSRTIFVASMWLTAMFSPVPAQADDRTIAANYFDAGAQAYDTGHYLIAAEAFLKAHELIKSPALQFSAAQAYRRQYLVDSSPDSLRRSVRLFRDYLRDDPSGKRREEAMSALADLVPLAARARKKSAALAPTPAPEPLVPVKPGKDKPAPIPIPVPGSTATPPPNPPAPDLVEDETEEPEPEPPRKTRVLVSIKPDIAEISIDDGSFMRAPAIVEVKPGSHKVRAKAIGYFDEEFQIDAVDKELVARHATLRPKPARLMVEGTAGSAVMIDGQLRATLPFVHPLEIEPGNHFVSVTHSGYVSFGKTITSERDQDVQVHANMTMTKQRTAAWTMFAFGVAGAATTGVLAGFALSRDATASNLDAQRLGGSLSPANITTFNNTLAERDAFVSATSIVGGASALVLLTSAGMLLFDNPDVLPVPPRQTEPRPASPDVEMSVGLASAALRIRF